MEIKEQFLQKLEINLSDLPVNLRNQILRELIDEVDKNPALIQGSPIQLVNSKRENYGIKAFKEKKKFSAAKFLLLAFLFMFISFGGLITFVIWKFTPIVKIDEENQRFTLLGGVIDIDGKSGKLKIFDEVHFAQENFNDNLQMNMNLPADTDEIEVDFTSGQFTLKTSDTEELKLDCKLSAPFKQDMIQQKKDLLKLDFKTLDGLTCEIQTPQGKRLILEGDDSSINILKPEYNLYIEIENGHIAFTPQPEHDYRFDLEVKNGYVGEFNSAESEEADEIQIRVNNGAIVTK